MSATVTTGSLLFPQIAKAESVTVNCSGTSGSPTAVTEADLAADDVTFSDTGGDGYCVLDAAIDANSVVVGLGVVLTHAASDSTGVNITTTGNLTLTGEILVTGKGCAGGAESTDGSGPNTGTGVCAATTSGYGDASRGGAGHGGPGGAASAGGGTAGIKYGSPTAPTLLGSGGAGGPNGGETGGAGGGKVRLDVGGTLFVDGAIKANGNTPPTDAAAGGGSGGSIYITTATLDTTSGTGAVVQANGGNAFSHGGAGGGGRVAVYYNTLASDGTNFALTNITATKGLKGTNGNNGNPGSTFILNRKSDDGIGDVRVITGLDLVDGSDFARTNITLDSGSTITCDTQTTLNFTASDDFTDNGSTFNCTAAITTANITATDTLTTTGVNWDFTNTTTVNLSAATWTSSGTNTIDVTKAGSAMDWAVTNALTLNNLTYTGATPGTSASTGGVLSMDNAIAVSLVNTDINSNASWTGLSSLSIDADSSISANGKGCDGGPQNGNGYGPDTSTEVCTQSTNGYGANGRTGAGHGGAGGRSNGTANTGATYGLSTIPIFYGSGGGGGGNSGETGGAGGGKIRLDMTGTFTLNGTLSANGSGPADNAGGGSGGSVYVTLSTLAGSGTANSVTADGGAGINWGGGGGGGRVLLSYGTSGLSSGTIDSMMRVSGGASGGTGAAAAGSAGSINNTDLPFFSSALYKDSDANGVVDQVIITFDESVTIGGTVASTRFTWTSASGANGFAGSLSGNASASGTDVTITIDSAEANETGSTTVPTIAWNDNGDDGTDKIQDADGNIVQTFSAQNVSDGAKPVVISKQYQDVDANGTVERVLLTLSEDASTQTAVLGDFAYVANDITGSAIAGGTVAYPVSNMVGIAFGTAGNANITGHTTAPTIAYTDGGATAIADAAGNQLATFAAVNLSDGAAPVRVSQKYEDSDASGTVDRVTLTLSEAASTQTAVLGDFTYVANDITSSALAGGTLSYPSNTTVRLALGTAGGANITGHTTAPTLAYTDGGSTAIADAAGNQLATYAAASLTDGAAPTFVSAATTSTTNVRVTMSETVTTATFGAAGAWTATGFTSSAVAINGTNAAKLDLTVGAVGLGYTASDFAFTAGVSGSAITDGSSNSTASFLSKAVADGLNPDAPGSFAKSGGSGTTATFTWTATSDTNHNHYEIWYGTNQTDVQNKNGTASEWDNDNDADLVTRTTTTTTVTGLTAGNTYYALICAVDNASNVACSSDITFVTNQTPSVTTPSSISQATDGSGYVTFSTTISDADGNETKLKVEYSENGGASWYDADLVSATPNQGAVDLDDAQTYQIGTSNGIDTDTANTTVTIVWAAASASNGNGAVTGEQSDIQVRVTANDSIIDSSVGTSASFTLDLGGPSGLASFASSSTTSSTITWTWTAATSESNFDHYEIWYGTTQSDVENRTGTASEWDADNDASFSTMATVTTTITGLSENTSYYAKIWAIDDYGNETTLSTATANNNGKPTLSGLAATQATNASGEVTITFTIDDDDDDNTLQAKIEYNIGASWVKLNLSEDTSDITATRPATPDVENDNTYQVGNSSAYILSSSGANTITALWPTLSDSGSAFNTNSAQIRITPYDGTEEGSSVTLSNVTLDNTAPSSMASLAAVGNAVGKLALTWVVASDINFDKYSIWYGTDSSDVTSRTGTASGWYTSNDSDLDAMATADTTITADSIDTSVPGRIYYVKIFAVDTLGNEATIAVASFSTGVSGGSSVSTRAVTEKTVSNSAGEEGKSDKVAIEVPKDTDRDGLTDDEEVVHGTDPRNKDTDHDGIEDGAEVKTYKTNPLDSDTDKDGYADRYEIFNIHTDPLDVCNPGNTSLAPEILKTCDGKFTDPNEEIKKKKVKRLFVGFPEEDATVITEEKMEIVVEESPETEITDNIIEIVESPVVAPEREIVESIAIVIENNFAKLNENVKKMLQPIRGNYDTETAGGKIQEIIETKALAEAPWSERHFKQLLKDESLTKSIEKSEELAEFVEKFVSDPNKTLTQIDSLKLIVVTSMPDEDDASVDAIVSDFNEGSLKVAEGRQLFVRQDEIDEEASLTRGQALALLFKTGDAKFRSEFIKTTINNLSENSLPFSDVSVSHQYAPYVLYFYSKGYLSGYGDGTFRPDAPMTNAEFVKLLNLVKQESEKNKQARGNGNDEINGRNLRLSLLHGGEIQLDSVDGAIASDAQKGFLIIIVSALCIWLLYFATRKKSQ